jgi:hypothetical protein
MEIYRWLSSGVAALFEIDAMIRVGAEVACPVRFDGRV